MVKIKASKLTFFAGLVLLFIAFLVELVLVSTVVEEPIRDHIILLVLGTLFFGGVIAFFGGFLIYSYFKTTKHLRNGLKTYGEENLQNMIQNKCISTYTHPLSGYKVYFTEELVIDPRETIIDYNEISLMYKQVTRTNGVSRVYLQFSLKDGTSYSLCNGIEDAMIHNYMQLCFQHNNRIMFGYSKENLDRYKQLVKDYKRENGNGK